MSNPSAPPIPAVQITGLTRTYGTMTALNSLDLTILKGDQDGRFIFRPWGARGRFTFSCAKSSIVARLRASRSSLNLS